MPNETQVRGVLTEDRHIRAVRESVLRNGEVVLQRAGVTPRSEMSSRLEAKSMPGTREVLRVSLSWMADNYWLTRTVFQRGLALVYLIAFLNAVNQFKPLLGENGLLPVPLWIRHVPFRASPSLFYLAPKDWAFSGAAWLGVVLSCLALTGIAERYSTLLSVAVWGLLCGSSISRS